MNLEKARKEAKKLRKIISEHNYQYHVLDDPEISDADFDRLFNKLEAHITSWSERKSDGRT